MIVNTEQQETKVSSNIERYSGTIAMNAEMFSMLMEGIYEDKVYASVREPLFNAVDSHTEAGKSDVPIIIHSPTHEEPFFSVTDEGLGMSKETVTELFMCLGSSTKRNSNELIGAKGIGSKAPFTMTDSFTVISRWDGVETVYAIYKDKGLPYVSPISENKTKEGNGVEIKFAVSKHHIMAFREAIIKCLRYATFPYKINDPLVKQQLYDLNKDREVINSYKENGWRVDFLRESNKHNKTYAVIMGHQPYASKYLNNSEHPSLALYIPIGTCDVSPSREWTVEDEDHSSFVKSMADFIERAISKKGEEVKQKCKEFNTFKEVINYMGEVGNYFSTRYCTEYLFEHFREDLKALGRNSLLLKDGFTYLRFETKRRHSEFTLNDFYNNTALVYDDVNNKYSRSRSAWLMSKHGFRSVYVSDADVVEELYNNPYYKGLVFKLSELEREKTTRYSSNKTEYVAGHLIKWIDKEGKVCSGRIKKSEFRNMVESVLFFPDNYSTGETVFGRIRSLPRQQEGFLTTIGCKADRLYLIPEDKRDWIKPKQVITERKIKKSYIRGKVIYSLNSPYTSTSRWQGLKRLANILGIETYSVPTRNQRIYIDHSQVWKLNHQVREIVEFLTRRLEKRIEKEKINMFEKYPLLQYIDTKHYNNEDIKNYRQMVDKNRGEKNNDQS